MSPARAKSTVVAAVFCLAALAAEPADARKPGKAAKAPPPPNADQQMVVARIVDDTFRRPKREPLTLALCLDVRIEEPVALDDDGAPVIELPRRSTKKRARKPEPPPIPDLRVQGAPAELVERLVRPWRQVASASSCRLDPRLPFALPDEHHTAAQLVTVHLSPDVAVGTIKIDWTASHDPTTAASRDCTAAHGPRGWEIHCGGTWFQ